MKNNTKNNNIIIYKNIVSDIENKHNIKLTHWQKFFIKELLENRFVSFPRSCGTSTILKSMTKYLNTSFNELNMYFDNRHNKFHHYVSILEMIKELPMTNINWLIKNSNNNSFFEQEYNIDYNTFLKLVSKYVK